jgi:hypothetical protein
MHFISLERLLLVSFLLLQLLALTTSQSSFSGSAKWRTCGIYFLGMSLLLCNFSPLPCSRLLCLAHSFESSYSRLYKDLWLCEVHKSGDQLLLCRCWRGSTRNGGRSITSLFLCKNLVHLYIDCCEEPWTSARELEVTLQYNEPLQV